MDAINLDISNISLYGEYSCKSFNIFEREFSWIRREDRIIGPICDYLEPFSYYPYYKLWGV